MTVAEQSNSQKFLTLEDSLIIDDIRKSKNEDSEKDENLFEDDDESSVDIDITQLHASRSNEMCIR